VPKALRAELTRALPAALEPVTESVSDGGDTVKWLWSLADGARVETVLMHYPDRSTVCVSHPGRVRHGLQLLRHRPGRLRAPPHHRRDRRAGGAAARSGPGDGRRVSNVVFMGMGEPLANYDATWAAVERLHDDLGSGARHLTCRPWAWSRASAAWPPRTCR
jgi:23S rRNA (adenine2503-C2)-methyltransferase